MMLCWASIPKVVGSNPTVARHIFQACPVWIYTQSSNTYNNNVTSYSDDDECIFCVQQFPNLPTTNINVDGLSIAVVIDSGATVNIVDSDTYYELRALKNVEIMPSNIRLFTYGSKIPLNILGTITVTVECAGKHVPAQICGSQQSRNRESFGSSLLHN